MTDSGSDRVTNTADLDNQIDSTSDRPDPTATGPLVRLRRFPQPPQVWTAREGFVHNIMATNVAVVLALPLIGAATTYFPLSSLRVTILVVGSFCIAEAFVYALLVSTFPRNGGDYVYQTRLLSPSVSVVCTLAGIVIGGAILTGCAGWLASRLIAAPLLAVVDGENAGPWVAGLRDWTASSWGVVALGITAVVWSAALTGFSMRAYAHLQRTLAGVCTVAILGVIAYLSLRGAAVDMNDGIHRMVLYRAAEAGFRQRGHLAGTRAILDLLPLVALGLFYPGWVMFHAAEVKGSSILRTQVASVTCAKVLGVIFALVLIPLPMMYLGERLFGASLYLLSREPAAFWDLAPELIATSSTRWLGTAVLLVLSVAISAWFWAWLPTYALAASRVLQAMAWDHVLPRWFGYLHPRLRTPTHAILAFSALSCPLVVVYSGLGIWRLVLHASLMGLVTCAVTCLAAALFPFRLPEQYRMSTAAPFEILRVPVITICALAFLVFAGVVVWSLLRVDRAVLDISFSNTGLPLLLSYAVLIILYLVLRRRRRTHEGPYVETYYRDIASP